MAFFHFVAQLSFSLVLYVPTFIFLDMYVCKMLSQFVVCTTGSDSDVISVLCMCCAYCGTDHQAEFDLTVLTILLSSIECSQHCVYIEKTLHKTFKMLAVLIADDIQTLRTRGLQHM